MDKMFDLILIGRGLSNLLFISQYLKAHQNLKILILEKNKKIDERFISTWQGPGLIDLKKEYNIFPIQSFNEISVSEKNNKIKRKIKPYKYQTYQYSEIINILLNQIKARGIKILYSEVSQIKENKKYVSVSTNKEIYKAKYVLNSSPHHETNIDKLEPVLYQYFIGTTIKKNKDHNIKECQLMNFIQADKEIAFNYVIPLNHNSLLVETTAFGRLKNFDNLEKLHQISLTQYKTFKSLSVEKGIIPMSISQSFKRTNRIIPTGISGGFARPSSGYLLLRAATWAKESKNKNLNQIVFKEKIITHFLDKVFIKACYFYPDLAPEIFMKLFNAKCIQSIIRFLADIPSYKDLLNLIKTTPKKIMIYALFK